MKGEHQANADGIFCLKARGMTKPSVNCANFETATVDLKNAKTIQHPAPPTCVQFSQARTVQKAVVGGSVIFGDTYDCLLDAVGVWNAVDPRWRYHTEIPYIFLGIRLDSFGCLCLGGPPPQIKEEEDKMVAVLCGLLLNPPNEGCPQTTQTHLQFGIAPQRVKLERLLFVCDIGCKPTNTTIFQHHPPPHHKPPRFAQYLGFWTWKAAGVGGGVLVRGAQQEGMSTGRSCQAPKQQAPDVSKLGAPRKLVAF